MDKIRQAHDISVFGIYLTRSDAQVAVKALRDSGFSISDISVLLSDEESARDLATDKSTRAPEGAALGLGSGAAVGGALGWLVGAGALVIPGIGPMLAAGPIFAAVAGIGVGCALGGFTGALVGVGISEPEAEKYQGRLSMGSVLIAVNCKSEENCRRALRVLQVTGAEDISSSDPSLSNARPASRLSAA